MMSVDVSLSVARHGHLRTVEPKCSRQRQVFRAKVQAKLAGCASRIDRVHARRNAPWHLIASKGLDLSVKRACIARLIIGALTLTIRIPTRRSISDHAGKRGERIGVVNED